MPVCKIYSSQSIRDRATNPKYDKKKSKPNIKQSFKEMMDIELTKADIRDCRFSEKA